MTSSSMGDRALTVLVFVPAQHGIWSHHFIANRWGNSGNSDRPFWEGWGSKITADGDCSHEIKRCLLLGRKVLTNLDSILKSRNITLPTKLHLVKAMVFPVVMYGCESWTLKEYEHWRTDVFELWCWRRLLRVPWTARKPNQSILRNWIPEYSLEGLMLELKLQYWLPDVKNWLIRKDPDAGKDWRQEEKGTTGWDGWMASLTRWTWVWAKSESWWWTGRLGVLQPMGSQRDGHDWATKLTWYPLWHSINIC